MFINAPHVIIPPDEIVYYEKNYSVQNLGNKAYFQTVSGSASGTTTSAETVAELTLPFDILILDWKLSSSRAALSTLTSGQVQSLFYVAGLNMKLATSVGSTNAQSSLYLCYETHRFENDWKAEASPNFRAVLVPKDQKINFVHVIMSQGGAPTSFELNTEMTLLILPVVVK